MGKLLQTATTKAQKTYAKAGGVAEEVWNAEFNFLTV